MTLYTPEFYEQLKDDVRRSAEIIVPLLLEFVRPQTVVDIGCGLGTWLSVFKHHGLEKVLGVDGDYVQPENLEILPSNFISTDLTQKFAYNEKFDLVISLEVAEHLPGDCAERFVETLTGLGPLVLFSAAIPHQGGTGHVNEQWPAYWAEIFEKHDFLPIDCIRRRVWRNENVCWWYAQNMILYAKCDQLEKYPSLLRELEFSNGKPLSLVHPTKYGYVIDWCMRTCEHSFSSV